MKYTTYEISIRTSSEHASALRGAGMTPGTCLQYDGGEFREGSFDVEKWDDEAEAIAAVARLSEEDDFGPGTEMVLTREVYDEEDDDCWTEEILVKPLDSATEADE